MATYVKGVRTRYRNTLSEEISKGKYIVTSDIHDLDKSELIADVDKCMAKLKLYTDKLEMQSDKVACVLSELEPENTEQLSEIAEEDESLCSMAIDCHLDLHNVKQKILKEEEKPKSSPEHKEMIEMQQEFQKLVVDQMKQQQDFYERQEKKETDRTTSVKLPKLDMRSFNGDKLKWQEFWDSFNTSVHCNKTIPAIQKFNYLKSKLYGEAMSAISGLELSGDNYAVAVKLLHERFGNEQEVVDLHYHKMINIQSANNSVHSLRTFLDTMEKHLRSLEVLHQDINQDVFIAMIRAKLPEYVLIQLEMSHGANKKWTLQSLREKLKDYIVARERAEKKPITPDYRAKDHTGGQRNNTASAKARFRTETYNQTPSFGQRGPTKGFGPWRSMQNEQHRVTSSETLVANNAYKQRPFISPSKDYSTLCRYCGKGHWSDECPTYRSIEDRKKMLKDSCYKCLKTGHRSNDCKRGKICVYCGDRNSHHRSLCPTKFRIPVSSTHLSGEVNNEQINDGSSVETPPENRISPENAFVSYGEMILMQTVQTKVNNPQTDTTETIRILLDSGSQRSYVTESLAKRLSLKTEGTEEINVMTFGSDRSKNVKTKVSSLQLKLRNGEKLNISVNIVPVISGVIQRKPIGQLSENATHLLQTVELADTVAKENESCEIEILLGNDYYLDIVLCQKIEIQPGLYLLSSKCGWILTGRTKKIEDESQDVNLLILTHGSSLTKTNSFTSTDSCLPMKPTLEDFWKVESIGIMENPEMSNDERAMKHFKETLKFYDGRYQVTWPWKDEEPNLPVNRELAYGRLKSTISKLQRKPELMKKYNCVIDEQLKKGMIEEVDKCAKTTGLVHYIPHHAVVTPSKSTTKLRIVYDASARAKQKDKSLNENLYRGPVMLHDLCGMLMRFRLHRVAMVADIEKAFLQIGIQPCDRDVTRFLWIKDFDISVTETSNIIEYRFCRVPFGVISSPFLLGATVESHLDSIGTQVADKLKNDIYVDNLVTGTKTTSEAIELYQKAKSIFDGISMNLREWMTNDEHVNTFIQDKDRANPGVMKVLGHNWDTDTDQLSIQSSKTIFEADSRVTKRSVLKKVASIFDPLGLYSPTLLNGKLLLQTLWSKGLDWDEEISDTDKLEWKSIEKDLKEISECKIHRCVTTTKDSDEYSQHVLTCFCDASAKAYACCIYLNQEEKVKSKAELIFSKSRLAPVKKLTIPKLEIMAVLIGVRCLRFVRDQLGLGITQCFLWTDSQCVLHWIRSKKDHSVFIRNRVKEINTHKEITFGYVPSSQNPADIATRGASTATLQNNEMWWHGPKWLSLQRLEWPNYDVGNTPINEQTHENIDKDEIHTASQKNQIVTNMCVNSDIEPYGIDVEKFSSLTKLLRVTAYVSRFIQNIRGGSQKTGHLISEELKQAEIMWLRYVQKKHFFDTINSIETQKPDNLQRQLGLFLDDVKLLRCRGRLDNADLSFGARYPVLIPKCDNFTKLLIRRTHEELLHSGVSQTLSKIRFKYWIVRGRATVKSVIKSCYLCRRLEGGPYKMPVMPPLPKSRVSESAPFSRTGLDYLGPLFIKTENGIRKIWVCLFTCLVIRAVHLEMVNDMTSEEFLMAFRRFVSQRGSPEIMISDNALQFKAANKTLENVLKNVVQSEDVQSYASNAQIKWKFIVELSPWMGGYYERLVGLVKRTLRKTVGRNLVTSIQMQTLLKETEAVLNSRPLVYVDEDIDSSITITPAHFLSLNRNIGLPEIDKTDEVDDEYLPFVSSESEILKLWKKGHKLLHQFWRLWRNDYLLSLRERSQSLLKSGKLQSEATPSVGEVVLIKEDLPRGCWKYGKIVDLPKSFDGEIRSGKVILPSGRIIGRPLKLLFPLETSANKNISNSATGTRCLTKVFDGLQATNNSVRKSERHAAISARNKIKQML